MPIITEPPCPVALLTRINREAKLIAAEYGAKKTIWQALDNFIVSTRDKVDIDWPESVFMPFGLWPYFLEYYYKFPANSFDLDHPVTRGMAQVLSCLAPWRATQDIVRFDPEIEAELKNMELAGKLPSDILSHLPAWSIFIDVKLTVENDHYDGFFVQLDCNHTGVYMALTFQGPDNIQNRIPLALGDFTLAESLAEVNKHSISGRESSVKASDPGLIQAINLVIYLCAYGLQDKQDYAGNHIAYPKPKKIKKVWRIMPPPKPTIYLLGKSFGENIRREKINFNSVAGTKRPHIRRPHWHHFWKGPVAERQLIVRWLPPIFVGNFEREEDGDHS